MPIITERCAGCHASQPSLAGFAAPPLGVMFDSPEQVDTQAERIYQTAVNTRTMPLGNFTGITEEERKQLSRWYFGLKAD
jgi:uncharacterized membrane protein